MPLQRAPISVISQETGQSIQRGDGLLRNGSRIWFEAHIVCSVVPDCAGGEMDCAALIDGNATTLQSRCSFGEFTKLHWGDGVGLSQG